MWKRKETANTAELFEKNLIRWVVPTREPFTVIESLSFCQTLQRYSWRKFAIYLMQDIETKNRL
ncbi:hypothetical protein V1527DRAFT_474600 [Lipomyces starkeyi]